MADTLALLTNLLRPRVDAAGWTWLDAMRGRLAGGKPRLALLEAVSGAPRRLGKGRLDLSEEEQAAVAAVDPDLWLARWAVADAGRAWLLHAADAAAGREPDATSLLLAAYEEGDSSEQQSWLRALAVLPGPERFLAAAIDSCRTSILPQFEAIACENPYPSRHFPELNFNQMVLKALFNDVALERIVNLHCRFNPELSRMADDYVSEREAAGRSVPADIWMVIGPHGSPKALERLQRYMQQKL
jgi:hypothetical protein